jgi:hypothetical protein
MDDKIAMVRKLTEIMDPRIDEGDATDCSRLAWLCLRLKEEKRAHELVTKGLQIDPTNEYCVKLRINLRDRQRRSSA